MSNAEGERDAGNIGGGPVYLFIALACIQGLCIFAYAAPHLKLFEGYSERVQSEWGVNVRVRV